MLDDDASRVPVSTISRQRPLWHQLPITDYRKYVLRLQRPTDKNIEMIILKLTLEFPTTIFLFV